MQVVANGFLMMLLSNKFLINLPSGNVFGIFAVAGAVRVANFEDSSNGAAVFASNALQADKVLSAVFGVGVSGEWASIGHLTGSWAAKSSGNFCKFSGKFWG